MRGSWRGDVNPNHPEADEGIPATPDSLNDYALMIWNKMIPLLNRMKVLTKQDEMVLERYCILWSRWKKAEEFIEQHGTVIPKKDKDGKTVGMVEIPQVKHANELADKLLKIEVQFGLTPSARSRVEVNTTHKKMTKAADKSKFFKGA